MRVRGFLFDRHLLSSYPTPIPAICVGNVAVGGTGKTPHAAYLLRMLSEHYKVAYLSRGYKRLTRGFLLAGDNTTALDIGDEAMLIHSRFPDIPVAVDKDRLRGIRKLKEAFPQLQVVVLDDAMQYRRLTGTLNILLTQADNLYCNDHYLPLGRLRDDPRQARRADVVIVTKCPNDISEQQKQEIQHALCLRPQQELYFSQIRYMPLRPLFGTDDAIDLATVNNDSHHVTLVTAIAQPQYLYEQLLSDYPNLKFVGYADHHYFTADELNRLSESELVITTEKDATRLRLLQDELEPELRKRLFVVPIEVTISNNNKLNLKILNYVTDNSTDS